MGFQREFARTTELPRYWALLQNQLRFALNRLLCGLILFFVILVNANADVTGSCPAAVPASGIFSSAQIYKDSVVAIESGVDEFPISLSLYRRSGSGCEKTTFAKYSKEGGDPVVDSVFFLKLHGVPNVFTIVHWDVNSRGVGTFGKLYQVYAYAPDQRGGLSENEAVVNNSAMTGMDGYQDGNQVSFPYKNADAVKSFFKCKHAICR